MDQKKIGAFLKELRNEKALTQEQLAQHLLVSGRTVSRWETGRNLPDLSLLVELADFYDVDIRELMNGERKRENMDRDTKDTLVQVAQYADNEKQKLIKRNMKRIALALVVIFVLAFLCGAQAVYENHRLGGQMYREANVMSAHCSSVASDIAYLQEQLAKDEREEEKIAFGIKVLEYDVSHACVDFGYANLPILSDVRVQYQIGLEDLRNRMTSSEKLLWAFTNERTAKEIDGFKEQLLALEEELRLFCADYRQMTEQQRYLVNWSQEREELTELVRLPE